MGTDIDESDESDETASSDVLRCSDLGPDALAQLLAPWGIEVIAVEGGRSIPGSHWGAPEAGIRGPRLYVRGDTPVHSALHEASHLVCMGERRRASVDTDAGGNDLEESAVCYLQIILASALSGVGSERLMRDMDSWGYSFRLGSAAAWLEQDAEDAAQWLQEHHLLDADGRLRQR